MREGTAAKIACAFVCVVCRLVLVWLQRLCIEGIGVGLFIKEVSRRYV